MPELLLDEQGVVAGVKQVRGVGVPKRMQAQLRR